MCFAIHRLLITPINSIVDFQPQNDHASGCWKETEISFPPASQNNMWRPVFRIVRRRIRVVRKKKNKVFSFERDNFKILHGKREMAACYSIGLEDLAGCTEWVVDSGSTHIMSHRKEIFTRITDKIVSLREANGTASEPACFGFLKSNQFGLRVGLYHPSLMGSLLSTTVLSENGCGFVHNKHGATISDPERVVHKCSVVWGLPHLEIDFCAEAHNAVAGSKSVGSQLMHERVGHFSVKGIVCNCST